MALLRPKTSVKAVSPYLFGAEIPFPRAPRKCNPRLNAVRISSGFEDGWGFDGRVSVLECGSPVPPSDAGPTLVHSKAFLPRPALSFFLWQTRTPRGRIPAGNEYEGTVSAYLRLGRQANRSATSGTDAPSQGGTGLPHSKTLARPSELPTPSAAASALIGYVLSIARVLLILTALASLEARAADVKIEFIPPPMEGTISLGIYDVTGKLVRVLRKEAESNEFTVALNGLIARWDGADNAGAPCPPGKYHARGWRVGELVVEGVDFIGNDWITGDDSPRISHITNLAVSSSGTPLIQAIGPGQVQPQVYAITTGTDSEDNEPEVGLVAQPNAASAFATPAPTPPAGKSVSEPAWKIDGAHLKKLSPTGAALATFPWTAEGAVSVKLAASPVADKVYVLAEAGDGQRVQALDCTGIAPGSPPKLLFDAGIRHCDRYEQVASLLKFPNEKPFVPVASLPVVLVPNPLFQDQPGTVTLRVLTDATGAFLATADGLPLAHISETPHLRWAAMGRPPGVKVLTVFESDGAVVGEFTVARFSNMMEFDAGEIELPAPSAATR